MGLEPGRGKSEPDLLLLREAAHYVETLTLVNSEVHRAPPRAGRHNPPGDGAREEDLGLDAHPRLKPPVSSLDRPGLMALPSHSGAANGPTVRCGCALGESFRC